MKTIKLNQKKRNKIVSVHYQTHKRLTKINDQWGKLEESMQSFMRDSTQGNFRTMERAADKFDTLVARLHYRVIEDYNFLRDIDGS